MPVYADSIIFAFMGFRKFAAIAAVVGLLSGCSTEVDLNADWQETTVVYGLLDQTETYHFLRINKSFLGDGNALDMALVRDSSEYDPSKVDARIDEYVNNILTRTWQLRDTTLLNRDENGDFYYPEYTAYYFVEPALNANARYVLTAEIGPDGNKKTVTAETELIRDFTISSPLANIPGAPSQFNVQFISGGEYRDFTVKFTSSVGSKRFNLQLALHYLEFAPSDTVERILYWNLGDEKAVADAGGELFEMVISGQNFYTWLASRITSSSILNDPAITKRQYLGIDFIVSSAADELNTYMELNEPVTGIVQERPSYTNVVNGIGLFSARYSKTVPLKWLNFPSLVELNSGQYTAGLLFCVDTTAYVGESFYCP
jgi:hypothetical protein